MLGKSQKNRKLSKDKILWIACIKGRQTMNATAVDNTMKRTIEQIKSRSLSL